MVADNKQPASNDQAKSVGSDKEPANKSNPLGWLKASKKRLFIIVTVILLLAAWAHFGLHIGQKVYAQAAGHKIYKKEIDDLIGKTKGVSQRQAATVLANKYLTEAMVKEAGLTVSNQDIVSQYGTVINKQKTTDKYIYQQNVNNVYFSKLLAYNSGLYKGKLIAANFSGNIAYQSPLLTYQQANNPLLGNPETIAHDKNYAKNFINQTYEQIKSGQITFDQAIQKEHDDPELGFDAYKTLPHSGPFDTSNVNLGGTTLISPKSIQSKIAGMKAGQLSAPFAVTVPNSSTNKKITTESYYLIVRMDSTSGSHSGLNYNQYLAQAKKRLGYKVNV